MHSKFGLFQMSSLSLCAALSKVNFVVYYNFQSPGVDLDFCLTPNSNCMHLEITLALVT